MITLEDERYVVIKAYKCTVSEIWRDFFCISIYCVYVVSLHIESTDSMIVDIIQQTETKAAIHDIGTLTSRFQNSHTSIIIGPATTN